MAKNKNKHCTSEERKIIQTGIENGSSKAAIAETIGKDKSTIGKEIKLHRSLSHKCSYHSNCAKFSKCRLGRTCINCIEFEEFRCSRRDRSPGACNGCSKLKNCRYDKYMYDAEDAQDSYESTLVDSRLGVNMTYSEAKAMADIVVPLIKNGQSPYMIIVSHPELGITEKTLYNYIENGIFCEFGLLDIDLRVKVKRKMTKDKSKQYKKREDKAYLKDRKYKDFLNYTEVETTLKIVEMDTVYNDISNGPYMQTFKFRNYAFTFAIYHDEKTALEMVNGVDLLEKILGKELFSKEVQILLTDRGSEFTDAEGFEKKDENGTRRTRVFYCDAMASGQKGSLENKHKEYRYILPKDTDLRKLGLTNQESLNLAVSHINSAPVEFLNGKSPIEYLEFMNPELWNKFKEFGIKKIEKDKVILKPYLLK